jgi:hypothetical protein
VTTRISNVLNVAELIDWATRNISPTPMMLSTEVLFISPLKMLPSGGTIVRRACGTMIHRIALAGRMPRAAAASDWPRSTDSMPARMTSEMYALSWMVRPTTAACTAPLSTKPKVSVSWNL